MIVRSRKSIRALLPIGAVIAVTAAGAVVAACSSESEEPKAPQEGIGLTKIAPVANGPEAVLPMDATPSPDGNDVYFIAFTTMAADDGVGDVRVPAVFKVSASGGAPTKLHAGKPFGSPFGITISDDGQTLFIADSSADGATGEEGAERSDGRVLSLPAGGGTPALVAGTEHIIPAGIEVMGGSLYVTGRRDGAAGLFRLPVGGGALTTVASGGAFSDPGGVAVARNGDAYVVDTGGVTSATALASVIKIDVAGKTEVIHEGIKVGHPAGIALVNDDSAVLVSALDATEGTDRVYRIELGSRQVRQHSAVIGEFVESAGLHRARNAEVFAWADSHANGTGTVYVLKP